MEMYNLYTLQHTLGGLSGLRRGVSGKLSASDIMHKSLNEEREEAED